MGRRGRAALCRELNRVVIEEIEVESPRRNEVMIKVAACGVCHSDLSSTNGTFDELITRRYRLDEAATAFADMLAGKNARGVIVFDQE